MYCSMLKLKIFRGNLGNFVPENPKNCIINAKKKFLPYVDESLGRKLWNLLRWCYFMVYICVLILVRFDGFITKKKNFGTKNLEKCFWSLAQKLGIGSNNNCLTCDKNGTNPGTDVLYLHAKYFWQFLLQFSAVFGVPHCINCKKLKVSGWPMHCGPGGVFCRHCIAFHLRCICFLFSHSFARDQTYNGLAPTHWQNAGYGCGWFWPLYSSVNTYAYLRSVRTFVIKTMNAAGVFLLLFALFIINLHPEI